MSKENRQPFTDPTQRSAADHELVERVSGTEVAAEMEELLGVTSHKEAESQPGELAVSADEQANLAEIKGEIDPKERRQQYYKWADKYGLEKEWIDEIFIFDADGTVSANDMIELSSFGISEFPPGFVEVNNSLIIDDNKFSSFRSFPDSVTGMLDASRNSITSLRGFPRFVGKFINLCDNPITSLVGLPDSVGGHLDLRDLSIKSLEGLPQAVDGDLFLSDNDLASLDGLSSSLGKDLHLFNIPATSIPEGLKIAGNIYLGVHQTALKADCEAKGYDVQAIAV